MPSLEERASPVRTVIVDDEPLARDWIREQLRLDEDIEVVAECEDGFQAVETISRTRPDLVFLDIQMPGLDGFGVLRSLEGHCPPAVVFVTAFDRYALQAFEVHAVDYLMKPVSAERLQEAIQRSKVHLKGQAGRETAAQLANLLSEVRRYPEWLLVKHEGRTLFVRVQDIDWIESSRNNVVLHAGTAKHVYHETTSGLAARLDPARFLRIHRSTIVNIERIKELHPWFNGDYAVTLKDGTKLTLSSTYRERLKEFRRLAV